MSFTAAHQLRGLPSSLRPSTSILLLVLALLLPSAHATAQTSPIALDAQLPERLQHCVTTQQLQASYDRVQANEEPMDPRTAAAPLRVELRSDSAASSAVTRVELRAFRNDKPLGARTLPIQPRDCAALPDTIALVIQVLTRSAPPEPPPPPAAAPPPPAQAPFEPEPSAAPAPEPPTDSGEIWSIGLGAGVVWGMLPRPAFAPQLMAAARLPILELRLHLAGMWPQERAVEEGSVRMWTYEAGIDACEALHFEPWTLRICVGPRVGLTRATSRDFSVRNRDLTEVSLYLAVLPELAFALRSTTWIQLRAGIAFGLQRPKFVLDFEDAVPPLELDGPRTLRAELSVGLLQSF